MASIQSLGVGSGLLTSELAEQIIEAERAPVENRLNAKQTLAEAKIAAFGEVRSAVSAFDNALQSLMLPSTFNASQVSSTSEAAVTATAGSTAVAGSYVVAVSQLAQSHALASQSYASINNVLGTGSLTFRFGTAGENGSYDSFSVNTSAPARTIVINANNNTLAGVRDAVNAAKMGVHASIVDDGSGYRLVFTSKESGANRSMEVVAGGSSGLMALNFNASSQAAPLNAVIQAGSVDLSTGGGLDTASRGFRVSYNNVELNVVVPSNAAIVDEAGALAAVQQALDAQLVANGFAAGAVVAASHEGGLQLRSAAEGYDTTLQVLEDGSGGLGGFGLNASEGVVSGSARMQQTIAAQDALFSVNGLAMSRGSNLAVGVIPGTTINLKSVSGPVTLTVSKDASAIATRLQTFVEAYNGLKNLSDALTAFNPDAGTNGQGSLLMGDASLRKVVTEINRMLRSTVTGLSGGVRSLADVGITTDQHNGYQLSFNNATFNKAFADHSADIIALFATAGVTTDSQISYTSATAASQPGTYDIEITRLATMGQYTGHGVAALGAGNIVIGEHNDQFVINLNGVAAAVTLQQGSYDTADDLAAQLQSAINSHATLLAGNNSVDVIFDEANNRFQFTSNIYGSASKVLFTSTESLLADTLGLTRETQGAFLGNELGGLATPGGLSSENFQTPVTLDLETSFKLSVRGITTGLITLPGSSGSPQQYASPDDLITAIELALNSDGAFAAQVAKTGYGMTLLGNLDFSASNLAVAISLDGGDTSTDVLIDGDTATVSYGGHTPGTVENTLAAVQAAIDATALNGQVIARMGSGDRLYFETAATGSGASIQVLDSVDNPGLEGVGIADTEALGRDAFTVEVGYSYDAGTGYGRLSFATDSLADVIAFSDVSIGVGNRLGLMAGSNTGRNAVAGVDVAGTINGVEASGSGQVLRGASGATAAMPGFYLNTAHGNLAASSSADSFRINVDGVLSDPITLGNISNTSPAAVASAMQSAINNSPALLAAGVSVSVEYDVNSGGFGIISRSSGPTSSVKISDLQGDAGVIFGLAAGVGSYGKSGTRAIGEPDPASGLRLQVSGGTLGPRGSVTYIKGVAEQLGTLLETYLGSNGLFAKRTESLNTELSDIAEQRQALEERIVRSEKRLRASFLANDKIISKLNTTADFLTSQLKMLEDLASASTAGK